MIFDHALQSKNDIDTIGTHIAEGRLHEAASAIEALLELEPFHPEAWHLKGSIALKTGNHGMAIACFNQALRHKPDFKEACLLLGRALELSGQFSLAIKTYEYLLQIERVNRISYNPTDGKEAEEWFYKGEAFQKQGDAENAAAAFRTVLKLHPNMPAALSNLGIALYSLRRFAEAEEILLYCLRVEPGHTDALNTLATCYKDTGHYAQAIAAYRQALAAEPVYLPAAINLGKTYFEMKHYDEAIIAYERALAIDSGCTEALCDLIYLLYRLCRWDKVDSIKAKIGQCINNGQTMEPFIVATVVDSPQMQLVNAQRYAATYYPSGKAYDASRALPSTGRNDGKLRIGYISGDFHRHATAYLISELFERHDREQFDIFAYSYGKEDKSTEQSRIEKTVDRFHNIRTIDDNGAADLIRRDGIDILVDLKGHTQGHRMALMAKRPAPLQIHYLGFPGTTGASFIDYFITDAVASPENADTAFSECLIRLPHCYQINDRTRALPLGGPPRSTYGLPEEGFVFCDFNNSYKITPPVFDVWMRLLAAVPGSVLWLYETHAEATINLKKEANKRGVNPSRIVTALPVTMAQHLARYRHADLFLDASPVCGHTTTSDALWCGVPMVAMKGESFISRVAASLLQAVGLSELVAEDLTTYESLALSLTCNKEKLVHIRRRLEEGRLHFPLFDSAATTHALETAYLHAAERHRAGLPPRPLTFNAVN